MASAPPLTELGVAGVQVSGGMVVDRVPALRGLHGERARWLYAEMAETDATIGSCLTAVELVCRSVEWKTKPAIEEDAAAEAMAEFVEGLWEDMSHSFDDFVSDAMTMTTYGFSVLEPVYKRRIGPLESDPAKRSKFDDGKVGLRKMVGRGQLTLKEWKWDDTGGVQAFVQRDPNGAREIVIPIERLLLFRTTRENGNPEGRSLLRACVSAWSGKRFIEQQEGIGIERDLTGLPIMRAPKEVAGAGGALPSDASADEIAARAANMAKLDACKAIVRDLKANEQGGLVLSSETYTDAEGKPTGIPKWALEAFKSPGAKPVDIDKAVARRETQIFRRFLAQFLQLGGGSKGSFALAESQTDLFVLAVTWLLDVIADTLNRHLLPRIWELNGFDPALMPTVEHDDVAPQDLAKLGAFITAMAGAGDPVGQDDDAANTLRRIAGLPDRPPMDVRAEAAAAMADMTAALRQTEPQADQTAPASP